jgi:EAL domain-containing protein (putative c-di-GMP-specific phosphodiesterase class I)
VGQGPELDALCRAAALARAHELPPDALLFLNLSPQTLERDSLSGDRLLRAVRDAGLEPDRVVLEITERAQARVDQVAAEAARLQGLGFRIALDDVGVGNSGLEMLRRLDLDFVKVDQSIIAGALDDLNVQAVLVAIVAYAHRAGAFVIAEGIESPEVLHFVQHANELDVMRSLSIEGGQGYLLGRPSIHVPPAVPPVHVRETSGAVGSPRRPPL